jgi:hypothetical protein
MAGELCRHTVPISHGSTAISEKEKACIFLLDLYLYFPDIARSAEVKNMWSYTSTLA